MGSIDKLFGAGNVNYTAGIRRASNIDKTDEISFKSANKVGMSAPKELSPSTMKFLAQLDGKITPEMADDLLATPYVSLDLNG